MYRQGGIAPLEIDGNTLASRIKNRKRFLSLTGFSLVSVIVLIVGIGVIVAVAAPIAIMMIQEARLRATLHEMESLKEAIALYHPGEKRGFGFIGDVGRFPTSLRELVENYNLLPIWSVTTGIGWKGPYIERGFAEAPDAYRQDGWGNLYLYDSATGVITSRGSDDAPGGTGYAHDFSTLALTRLRVGTIIGQIRDILGSLLPGVEVSVEEPVNGTPAWRTPPVVTDAAGFYSLSNVLVGRRRLRAILTSGSVTSTHFFYSEVTPHIEARADFRIARDVTIPGVPTALTATPTVFGEVVLEWLPPINIPDLAGFNIYRSTTEGFTPTSGNRIATLGLVHFFSDNTVNPDYIYHYIVRAFDRAGNESANFASVSASTARGTDNIRNVSRVVRDGTTRIVLSILNFSGAPITVERLMVSWTGGPTAYSGPSPAEIHTRIPTSAGWALIDDDSTARDAIAILDTPFTLTAYGTTNSEGILRVGFNATMPVNTAITVVFNPHLPVGDNRATIATTTVW